MDATIASILLLDGLTNGAIYATAKAGVTHYTRCLADQLRPYDVTVNCIAPGAIATERTAAEAGDYAATWSRVRYVIRARPRCG
mgnify:CR=1 FL=1